MIDIDQIAQQEPPNAFIYNYRFPAIDFKFQNTGTATAVLWQFIIKVIKAEIDILPTFDFRMNVKDNALQIAAVNNGWGNAHDCLIQIDEPTLNRLFPENERQFRGAIQSGKEQQILTLTKGLAQQDNFEALRKEFNDILLPTGIPIGVYGIELQTPQAIWTCKNDNNNTDTNNAKVRKFNNFYLVEDGFKEDFLSGARLISEVTYSAIIDASKEE